jgi:autotransporter-associated beta strand protein
VLNGRTIDEHLRLSGSLFSGYTATNVWAGPITLQGPGGIIRVNSGGTLRIDGVIGGTGTFTKAQAGDLVLHADNTYTGTTFVQGGNLFIDGRQPSSAVEVSGGGALRGTGTCGPVTNGLFGRLLPGSPDASGTLHISSGLTLKASSETVVRLNGPSPGIEHDQLVVTRALRLEENPVLTVIPEYSIPIGTTFEIIRNDGTNPVVGTFVGLVEGGMLVASNVSFRISYVGGDGNDITLTRESVPSFIRYIAPLTNGVRRIVGAGLPRLPYRIEATPNLNTPISWTTVGTNVSDISGLYDFIDADASLYPMRFYRVLSP